MYAFSSPWSTALVEASPLLPNETHCGHCHQPLKASEVLQRTGLCSGCYEACEKHCIRCHARLARRQLQLHSGLCHDCYQASEKQCRLCKSTLRLAELHWGSALCDACYAKEKRCKKCDARIAPLKLRWGTGLCDQCYDASDKSCRACETPLLLTQLHFNTGLCDACYDSFEKVCCSCKGKIELRQLHWGTGLCDGCYDDALARETVIEGTRPLGLDVWVLICSQLIFYAAPSMMIPSLYLEIGRKFGEASAAAVYAAVLTTTTAVSMAVPVPFGFWAERRGEREVYCGVTALATAAAVVVGLAPSAAAFAAGWAVLSCPLSLRGVRATYFARHVPADELSRVCQLASAAGLAGSILGPLVATSVAVTFSATAMFAAACHAVCAVGLGRWLPTRQRMSAAARRKRDALGSGECEHCQCVLSAAERGYGTRLCNACWDGWFRSHKRRTLVGFCLIAGLLEMSMSAGVVTTFQPIAVTRFGWGADQIAQVNLLSGLASIFVSLGSAQLRLPERIQGAIAALLYPLSVLLVTCPPLVWWRLIAGLVLGLKAQILFMAPFTAAFSRLIGRNRVTNALTTALCLAPLVGATAGTCLAPLVLLYIGTPHFMFAAVPAVLAVGLMLAGWNYASPQSWQRELQPRDAPAAAALTVSLIRTENHSPS